MDLGDIVLTNMNQFAGLTAKIIDELLKLIDSLLCTNAERKELKAFLESEKSLLENGDVKSDRSIFSSTTLDAKALSLKLEANGVKIKQLKNGLNSADYGYGWFAKLLSISIINYFILKIGIDNLTYDLILWYN